MADMSCIIAYIDVGLRLTERAVLVHTATVSGRLAAPRLVESSSTNNPWVFKTVRCGVACDKKRGWCDGLCIFVAPV